MTICFFDLETTGVETSVDKIVSISVIVINSETNQELSRLKYLINPLIPIPESATAIHRIDNKIVLNKPTFQMVANELYGLLNGNVLAGFNIIRFDVPLLVEEFLRCGLILDVKEVIDVMQIFHKREPRNLTAALKFYCGVEEVEGGAHDAENDVLATINVFNGQQFYYGIGLEDCITKIETIDFAGKLKRNSEGVICYTFGKNLNLPVLSDVSFANWMLGKDFSMDTKTKLRQILNGELK